MKIALKAFNGQFVCAELGGGINHQIGQALSANRPDAAVWEQFDKVDLSNGKFALKTFNGNFITAELDKISLSTDRAAAGPWEEFEYVNGDHNNRIKTHHGTYLTARLDYATIPLEQTTNTGGWEEFEEINLEPIQKRKGIVRGNGKCIQDDIGFFPPLGLTFFWALYGWKFEQDRIHQHLEWIKQFNFDYLRILGEVDWEGRSILPFGWHDYQQMLAEYIDASYDQYGLRTQLTLVGGQYQNEHEKLIPDVIRGREHKIMHLEVCNEWERLDKIRKEDMISVGKYLRNTTPNLVALSTPAASDDHHDTDPYEQMIEYTKEADCNMYCLHTRRSDHDNYWSHVRQGYDLKNFPSPTSNNEPQGPQSSVDELDNPMQLAMARACGVICNGPFYVLHVGQGVTGVADPAHGRPQNMWEVPNIDNIMKHVRGIDVALPKGIENWKCVNNGRDDHPMPLPDDAFWEGSHDGVVNKNYACISGNQFVECLLGVKGDGPQNVGKLKHDSAIKIYDADDFSLQESNRKAGESIQVNGRNDTMKGYVVLGNI